MPIVAVLKRGLQNGLFISLELAKVMIPVYIFIRVLDKTGALPLSLPLSLSLTLSLSLSPSGLMNRLRCDFGVSGNPPFPDRPRQLWTQ